MGIEHLNRWHWMVIGLLVGLGFAWVWSTAGADVTNVSHSSQLEFETDLFRKWGNQPVVSHITVGPPIQNIETKKMVRMVRYKWYGRDMQTRKVGEKDKEFGVAMPYEPYFRRKSRDSKEVYDDLQNLMCEQTRFALWIGNEEHTYAHNEYPGAAKIAGNKAAFTIDDFLGDLKLRHPELSLQPTLWRSLPLQLTAGAAAGVLVIGVIWPTLLNLMTGAGFGPKRKPKVAKVEAAAPSHGEEATMPARSVPVASDEQRAELDDMNRKLEEQLQAAGVSTAFDPEAPQEEDPDGPILMPTVRQLSGVSADPVKPSEVQEAEEVEIKGEFYPVLIHHKKSESKKE